MATCCGRPPDSGQITNSNDESISPTFTELVSVRLNSSYDDILEHCGTRPTEIIKTDNNAGSITPICGKEIATDSNLKCDSYRDKLLGGINKNADSVATNLAKAIKPAFQIPVRINGVQNDPKPENDNFTGVSRKRTSRFYITNIDPSSSKEGLLSYAKQRGVNITHVILFKPRKGRISGRINVTMESKPLLQNNHLPVFLQLSIPCVANSSNGGNTVWPSWRKASDSSLHAYNELTNEIAVDLLDMPLGTFLDLDTLASKLTDKLKECANIAIPSGSFNPNTKPYWSDQVKQAHKAERLARRTWINHGRPRGKSFPSYVEYKSAKNEFRNRQRFAYNAYMDNTYREIDEAAECDVRLFWRLISRRKCRKTNQISEILHDNRQCKSPEDISNAFADFYAGVYTPTENAKFDSDFKAYVTEFVDRTLESCAKYNGLLPGGEINIAEIETAIRNLKLQKAPGYDKLQNEHVRYSGSKLQTVILRIFNAVRIEIGRKISHF
ncbi:unnamed protein product [Mytilus edulis]|uniref:Uncharacterized protein n=1 Tax=Mytilus edulis TaxID=6550 RepID=A0A8S3TCY0_MYTED|nr:unnamed protein product [Mytilus edulis]